MYDDGLTIWVGDLDAWINVDFSGENEAERNAELLEEDLKEIGNISLFAQKSISSRTLLSKGIEPDAWRWSLHEAEIALGGIAIQGQIERRFVRKLINMGSGYVFHPG
ncbi:hypothetical protein [Sediminimonas qiaohouensis]|uniref:hypothetical protein n=1 Tax=Sediminimonas qiaohouensis TaxID=552061 RepID=UPI00047DC820|nr:hypothetical protein [Sediminimonas qiaohouensis]